ncbi:HTTM domain-containing protein [Deminuibacter soli]|uniref:HTTM domain-containing protein n=1 Tax=Deminuibacter soli TaxID=2291815 RepID=A0A3E1ND05_9BACT|nr:HTTM domain-containing protein [Deminuibacter soli]RFM25820.1 HTTM domain-containing protein [Deminuibacter soli]
MTMATNFFTRYRHIAPLAVLRMAFGAVLFISTLRFMCKGWVHDFYVVPTYHFPFEGFEWLHPLPAAGMYALYAVMALAALCICIGLFYRVAAPVFFLCFCYAELLDKTYYLNHYYFVTICAFLLTLVPAHRYCSVDVLRKPSLQVTQVPAWSILLFKYQLCIIYCCAGLSKLTKDWLLNAMPLKIWLPAKADIPVLGPLLKYEFTAYFFSWGGASFDLCIAFLLLAKPTRRFGYVLVIIFHVLTAVLFQIGMFPYLMMSATLIFFSEDFHKKVISSIRSWFSRPPIAQEQTVLLPVRPGKQRMLFYLLALYFAAQVLLPFRYMLYPGTLLWTEEGYRFSWRVMLMEKGGTTFFYVKDAATGKKFEVNNRAFLTPYQERMMETQPDMMLQYAHILKHVYQQQGIAQPQVTVHSYVTLNGSGSRLYIDSTVNLANENNTWFKHNTWVLPFTNKQSR